jgi:hypothetical protein
MRFRNYSQQPLSESAIPVVEEYEAALFSGMDSPRLERKEMERRES